MIGRTLHFASRWALASVLLACAGCYVPYEEHPNSFVEHPPSSWKSDKKSQLPGPSVTFTIASAGSAVKGTWKGAAASKAQDDLRPFVGIAFNDASGPVNVGAVLPDDDFLFLHPEGPAAWSGSVKMKRDAGILQMRGSCNHIQYSGNFTFDSNPEYARQANTLLTPPVDSIGQFKMMILNIELAELASYANAGLSSLSAVDVCALKEAKVTPAYLAATLKGGKFNVDDVRLMRMQKVPEDFPAACANCGKNYNAQEIVNLAAYGVDAQAIQAWAKLPYPFGAAEIAKFHAKDTRPEYVDVALRVFEKIKPEEIIKLNGLGVSTNYLLFSKSFGLSMTDVADLHLHGVTGSEIGVWMKARPALSSDDLIQLHISQVPPAYAALFYSTNIQASDVIRLKQVQVPAEEAAQWIVAGYPYGASDLVRLHVAKVPAEYAAGTYIQGRLHLSVDVMIRYWQQGMTAEQIRNRRR